MWSKSANQRNDSKAVHNEGNEVLARESLRDACLLTVVTMGLSSRLIENFKSHQGSWRLSTLEWRR